MKSSKLRRSFIIVLTAVFCSFISCEGQKTFGAPYLKLEKIIALLGVRGRIDHMDINVKDRVVYIAALGNNTLEVVDLKQGKLLHSIKGLDEPQGVGYIPQNKEIFVANGGNGDCYFYNAHSSKKTAIVHLPSDADDVRYDSTDRRIYAGYGEGGIAIIDAESHRQIGNIKLPAHPESFQLDNKTGKIFINLPDSHEIDIADIAYQKVIAQWKMNIASANFPMALDEKNHRLFIVCRSPAKLVVMDTGNGKIISMDNCVADADDIYYDEMNRCIYISGGEGYVNVFQEQGANVFKKIANIATRSGARTSLFVPQLQLFILAEPAVGDEDARLLVYKGVVL